MPPKTTYFLSGVMGGSGGGASTIQTVPVVPQDYRQLMSKAILAADATASIIDPGVIIPDAAAKYHPPGTPADSYWTDNSIVQHAFAECVKLAAAADVVVSYLPTASMGSAIELHAAREAKKYVLVIAPGKMRGNWVVRSYADEIFDTLDDLEEWLLSRGKDRSGRLLLPRSNGYATSAGRAFRILHARTSIALTALVIGYYLSTPGVAEAALSMLESAKDMSEAMLESAKPKAEAMLESAKESSEAMFESAVSMFESAKASLQPSPPAAPPGLFGFF